MDNLKDVLNIDSVLKFGVFVAGTLWVSALGVAAFWLKRLISRHESEEDREAARRTHRHYPHTQHGTNGRDYAEDE